ncbi:hypothetical protein HanXRQr2_Chr01g0000021 [Helianthus annuus]|uniref:Uncharacterized protein n=1 Tax=Helianthus annuus TaxID=4232 RepID=A0A9K3JRX8_HELAN|nr:hypothetical protein HanXRQr2_Chr01g0000021 [Helianthus annuus]
MKFDLRVTDSEPRIVNDFIYGYSRFRICVQQPKQQPFQIRRGPPRHAKLAGANLLIHHHEIWIVERKITGIQHEQNDSA